MVKLKTDVCVCQEGYRRGKEITYYGSDLNKWIAESCSREMTHINIDGLSHKKSKKIVRIIESKHSTEGMPQAQRDVLCKLSEYFLKINKRTVMFDHTFECYIVRGDHPYEVVEIEDLVNDTKFTLDNENLKKFLEFNDYQTIESLQCDLQLT